MYKKKNNVKATPFNPANTFNSVGLKAMIVPFLIGNGAGLNSSIGIEYGFLKRHSIGTDLFYNTSEDNHDKVYDTLGILHSEGNHSHSNTKGLFVYYRYYFKFEKLLEKSRLSLYTSIFYRYGQSKNYTDPLYKNDYIYQREIQNSVGILVGIIRKIKNTKNIYLDFNTGIFYKTKNTFSEFEQNQTIKTKNLEGSNFGIRVGFKVCLWQLRKFH